MSKDVDAGHVFLSYFSGDSLAADQIQQALDSAGLRVWRNTTDLWPGEDWRLRIRQAITRSALAFVACFSRSSLARAAGDHYEELTLALEQIRCRRPDIPWLIPVRLDDCAIPDLDIGGGRTLASLQHADLFGEHRDAAIARLAAAAQRILAGNPDDLATNQRPASGQAHLDAPAPSGHPVIAAREVRITATDGGVAAAVIYGNVTISAVKPGDHSAAPVADQE